MIAPRACTARTHAVLVAVALSTPMQARAEARTEGPLSPLRLGSDRLRSTLPSEPHLVHPGGKLLATAEAFRVCLWDLPSRRLALEIPLPRACLVYPIIWSADGQRLVVLE